MTWWISLGVDLLRPTGSHTCEPGSRSPSWALGWLQLRPTLCGLGAVFFCLFVFYLLGLLLLFVWTIFKDFIEFVTILLLFHVCLLFSFCPQGMQDLRSLNRVGTRPSCIGRWSLNCWATGEVLGNTLIGACEKPWAAKLCPDSHSTGILRW